MADAKEAPPDDIWSDWLRHPQTDKARKFCQNGIDQLTQALVSTAITSTDPKVVAIASQIRTFKKFLATMSAPQEKDDDATVP